MGWYIANGLGVGEWVMSQMGGSYFAERSNAIGLVRDDKLACGVVYENWNGRSIVCHIVCEDRMTPEWLAAIFDYPYNVCDVDKIIAPVSSTNAKALKLVRNMGFTEEARITDATPNGDLVLMTMAREQCRFLGERYGQKLAKTTAAA
jgi:hypothetical protein